MVKRAQVAKTRNFIFKQLKVQRRKRGKGWQMKQFNIKYLRALRMNNKRREMNNMNQLCGVDVIGYEITNYQRRHAVIRLRGGVKLRASFVEFHITKEEAAMRCFGTCRLVSHESILTPLYISYNSRKKRILVFYERYNCLLAEWKKDTEEWWKKAAPEMVGATRFLCDKGFDDLNVSDQRNFAIQHGKLKMLMLNIIYTPQKEASRKLEEKDKVKRESFKRLRDLLKVRLERIKRLNIDEKAFFELFNRDDIRNDDDYVQKLVTHPHAMDYSKCMEYFHDIQLANEKGFLLTGLDKVTERDKFKKYQNWIETIQSKSGQHLKAALPKNVGEGKKKKYRNEIVHSLVIFLRNINEHRQNNQVTTEATDEHRQNNQVTTEATETKETAEAIAQYYLEVYAEVQELFPGFLSLLHEEVQLDRKYNWVFQFHRV